MRGTAPHVGELICRAVDRKHIDIMVMGRRGLSNIIRIVMGSVSRYCMEQSNCHVLVIKEDIEEAKLKEDLEVQKKEKFLSDLNRNISRIAQGKINVFLNFLRFFL